MRFKHVIKGITRDVFKLECPTGTKLLHINQEDVDFETLDLHMMEPHEPHLSKLDRYTLHHIGEGEIFDATYSTQYLGWYQILGTYVYLYAEKHI
jgi:hypothetical protein